MDLDSFVYVEPTVLLSADSDKEVYEFMLTRFLGQSLRDINDL
ncbi:hypothetical protein DSOL_0902 [Desulfosporosinus metallidurans]|uniref:Uncharacterized protein n=1 Tax=Desulfosporosinus metallidurans TaxID=1888891 RepID=A0A1Q8R0S4_9FIRM|nr:hypothetical protein DSOL_0902 [Desulfosporosinus metallidurans]